MSSPIFGKNRTSRIAVKRSMRNIARSNQQMNLTLYIIITNHFFSIILLVVMDANYKFIHVPPNPRFNTEKNVLISSYGKKGDSGILYKPKVN